MTLTRSQDSHTLTARTRVHILDILRGFAIFGILIINLSVFAIPKDMLEGALPADFSQYATQWYDSAAQGFSDLFADGKFYPIFSFLFGLGFALQLDRTEAKGGNILSFYPRRLFILLVMGFIHAFIWWGDILRVYALLGFVLLFARHLKNPAVLALAVSSLLFSPLPPSLPGLFGTPGDLPMGSGFDLSGFLVTLIWQGPTVLGLFLLGLLAGRMRIFENLPLHKPHFQRMVTLGLPLGILLVLLSQRAGDQGGLAQKLVSETGALLLSATYISALSLYSMARAHSGILSGLASVGRMALSNYLLQSIICYTLFILFGLAGTTGAAMNLFLAVGIFALQIPVSMWWLRRFRYGPFEWAWRSLTYGKRQALRLR